VFKKKETTPKVVETMTRGEWMQKYWRPCAAFMYMACCLCDFAIFPIMFTVVQFWEEQASNDAFRQWIPITLQGGGLFHVSMCAVLGVSAYGRTQEKLAGQAATPAGLPAQTIAGASNGGSQFTQQPAPSISAPAGGYGNNTTNSSNGTTGFGSSTNTAGSGASGSFGSSFGSAQTTEVVTGFGGKPAPVIPPFPEK
jgi:hypothetical protein